MRRALPGFAGAVLALSLMLAGCNLSSSPQPDHSLASLPPGKAAASTVPTTVPGAVGSTPYETQASIQLGLAGDTSNWNILAARPAPPAPDSALVTVSDAVLPSSFVTGPSGSPARNTELLASATETDTSPQTVVYDINSRAVWSDGTPITGADFVYTWEAQSGLHSYRDVGRRFFTPASTLGYSDIASVRSAVAEPDRVVVTFAHPFRDWESLFAPILPAHEATKTGFDTGFTDPVTSLVSGGPFVVQSYQPGEGITLVRNPKWWGPAANLAAVDISFVASPTESAAGLQGSQLDAAAGALESGALASARAVTGVTTTVTATSTYDDLVANERSGPLSSKALRVALFATIDTGRVAAAARRDGFKAAAAVASRAELPGRAGYHDDDSSLLTGLAQAAKSDTPPATPTAILAQARVALEAGGFTTKGGHLRYRGHPVRLTLGVATGTPFASIEAAAVAQACSALHISLTTPAAAPGTEASRVATGRYDLAIVGATVAPFPSSLAATYGTNGPANLTGFSSAAMNALLARVMTLPAGLARTAAIEGVDQLVWTDAADLPFVFQPSVVSYQNRYVNLTPNPAPDGIGWNIASWGILAPT